MSNSAPISRQLCNIAIVLSPTPDGEVTITNVYNDMIQANESEKEMIISMASIITDGMKFGNWPKP